MAALYHLDTDFLIHALAGAGPPRRRLEEVADRGEEIQMSAVAWYEYSRGPRTPEHLAVGRAFLAESGIVPFSQDLATLAAEVFRNLGSPRRRAADIAIGVSAQACGAVLLTCNGDDFRGIPGLRIEATSP